MKRMVRGTMLMTLAVLASACEANPVAPTDAPMLANVGGASQYPISGTIEFVGFLPPESVKITPGGTVHLRNFLGFQEIHGDVEGEFTFLQNANVNRNTNGAAHGPVEASVTWNGLTGTLSGNFAGSALNGWFTGTWVLHGAGELDGYKFRFSYEGPSGGPFDYTGTVVAPASAG